MGNATQARDVAIVAGVALLVVLLLGVFGMGMMGPGMMGWTWGGGGWWTVGMAVGMLLFWGLVIAGVVALVMWLMRQGGPTDAGPSRQRPLDILRERYARGELTREQYEQMRRDLEG